MSYIPESTVSLSIWIATEAGRELFEISEGGRSNFRLHRSRYTKRFAQLVKQWVENSSMIIETELLESDRFHRQVFYCLKAFSLAEEVNYQINFTDTPIATLEKFQEFVYNKTLIREWLLEIPLTVFERSPRIRATTTTADNQAQLEEFITTAWRYFEDEKFDKVNLRTSWDSEINSTDSEVINM